MTNDEGKDLEPAGSSELVASGADLGLVADQLVEKARTDGVALTGDGGLLTGLIQRVLQGALETEITDHLGYEPHAVEGRGSGNSRNGLYPKTVRTEVGDVRLDIPRDRNGSFEPVTVPVGQRRLAGLDQMVMSLYAKGLTTGDIAAHLFDIYDQQVDRATISRITDGIVADMESWQSGSSDLGGQEGVEEGPVGFAGVEECSDPVVAEVAESEADAFGEFDHVVGAFGGAVRHLVSVPVCDLGAPRVEHPAKPVHLSGKDSVCHEIGEFIDRFDSVGVVGDPVEITDCFLSDNRP